MHQTMVDPTETTFTWTIKQFDMCPQLTGQRLESPKFSVGPYEFCVDLYPRGNENDYDKYVSLYLTRLDDSGTTEVSILNTMCVDDDKGLCTKYCRKQHKDIFKKKIGLGWSNMIERQLLLTTKRHELLPNNNLTIKYKISLLPIEDNENDYSKIHNKQASDRLSRDFQELLENGIHSDMTIVVCGSKFNVHRAVLECRCPQLVAQLKETKVQNEYSLPDIKPPVLKILLHYLYAGACSVSNMYKEITFISNAYGFPDFRNVFPHPETISASTEINVSRLSFKWNISEFNKLQSGEELVYPAFYYSAYEWDQMEITLTTTKSEKGSNELQLKFRKMCPAVECFIRCKIILFTPYILIVKEWEHEFKNENWIPPIDLDSGQIIRIMCSDKLNLIFEISITNKEAISKIETVSVDTKAQKVCVETIKNLKLLQQDYHTLYYNPKFSDITLCVEDSKFPAHKAILCARSPVFSKMFEHDMLEKKQGVITIEGMDTSTVSSVLQYIYCGCVDTMDVSEAIKIYAAADMYEMLALKDMCGTFLKSSINAENVEEISFLADAHHDENLKQFVSKYMTPTSDDVVRSAIGLREIRLYDKYGNPKMTFKQHYYYSKKI